SNSTLHVRDVYPNPANSEAVFEYEFFDAGLAAKISLHNILGTEFNAYTLDPGHRKLKIRTDHLSPGIYFYTLYINNENLVTRKLVVKR
ncbi:MAG: T9SS type A sorting domain-containing protein, partial [Cyanobacteria bacterium P01_H01_bin.74]